MTHARYMHAGTFNSLHMRVLMMVAGWLIHDGRLDFLVLVEFLLMNVDSYCILSTYYVPDTVITQIN